MANEQLRSNVCFGWVFTYYLHTPPSALEKNQWNEFVGKCEGLPTFVQKLEKLDGGTKTWCIRHGTLVINASELTKFRCQLNVLVCMLTLILIKHVTTIQHLMVVIDGQEFIQLNINVLIEKWMPI